MKIYTDYQFELRRTLGISVVQVSIRFVLFDCENHVLLVALSTSTSASFVTACLINIQRSNRAAHQSYMLSVDAAPSTMSGDRNMRCPHAKPAASILGAGPKSLRTAKSRSNPAFTLRKRITNPYNRPL